MTCKLAVYEYIDPLKDASCKRKIYSCIDVKILFPMWEEMMLKKIGVIDPHIDKYYNEWRKEIIKFMDECICDIDPNEPFGSDESRNIKLAKAKRKAGMYLYQKLKKDLYVNFNMSDHLEIEQIKDFKLGCFYDIKTPYEWGCVETEEAIIHFIGFEGNKPPHDYNPPS